MAIQNHNHKDSQPHGEDCPADPPIWGDGHNHFYTNSHAAERELKAVPEPEGPIVHHPHTRGTHLTNQFTCPAPLEEFGDGITHIYQGEEAFRRAAETGHNHDPRRHCIPECPRWDEALSPSFAEVRDGTVGEVIDERVNVYGDPVETFARQAQAISALLDHEVHAWQVPLIMIMVKMVRVTEAPDYSDNSDDIEGYLDIFRKVMGEDMIHARSVKEYVELKKER